MPVQTITTKVELVSPTGSVVVGLSPTELSWTQDESTSPMFTGRTTVVMPTAAQFAMLRPGSGYFLRVGGWPEPQPEQTYLFKIVDRTRTPLGLVELQFGGPEVDLQAYTPTSVDRSCWAMQGDSYQIVSYVLTKVWGTKWARFTYGTAYGQNLPTTPYRTYQAATNLLPNGSFEYALAPWSAASASIGQTASWSTAGGKSLYIIANSTSTNSFATAPLPVQPNTTYTLSADFQNGASPMPSGSHPQARMLIAAVSVSGSLVVVGSSAAGPNTAYGKQRLSVTFTTPSMIDPSGHVIRLYNGSKQADSITAYWDAVALVEGDGSDTDGSSPIGYFDGDTIDGIAGYNYDWQGDPGNSSATRTPVVDRDPESLTWSPGQSAWDFLQPILQTAGWHLWCDSYDAAWQPGSVITRCFIADNSFGFSNPARRVLQGFNLLDASIVDSWSAEFSDGTPMYADQVILHYTWNDSLNQPREAYDVYPSTGKKPYYVELEDTPFAGNGRAQGIWKRISARASIAQGITWFDRGTYPGQQLALTADALGGSYLAYLEATTHDPFRGTTEFRTKQTIAYTSKSWYAATGSWASQTGTWAGRA